MPCRCPGTNFLNFRFAFRGRTVIEERREVLGCSSRRAGLDPPFRGLPRPRTSSSESEGEPPSFFAPFLSSLLFLAWITGHSFFGDRAGFPWRTPRVGVAPRRFCASHFAGMRISALVFACSCALGLLLLASMHEPGRGHRSRSPRTVPFTGAPWLGVSMDPGGDFGVRIESVVRGSPAERGGLRVGDRIVAIDGNRVTAPGHVSRLVATQKVGETITVALERTGQAIGASLVLASRPSSEDLLRMHLLGAPAPAWSKVTPLSGAPPR